jgi:hypothetical protein
MKVNFETNLFASSNNILEQDFVMEDVSNIYFDLNVVDNMNNCLANMYIENNEFPNFNDNVKSKRELDRDEIHYNDVIDFTQRPMEVVWN